MFLSSHVPLFLTSAGLIVRLFLCFLGSSFVLRKLDGWLYVCRTTDLQGQTKHIKERDFLRLSEGMQNREAQVVEITSGLYRKPKRRAGRS